MKAHGHATAAKLCRGAPWCKRMIWAFAHFWYSSWNRSVWSVTHGMKQANPSGSKNWKKNAKICKTKIKWCGIFQNQTNIFKTFQNMSHTFLPIEALSPGQIPLEAAARPDSARASWWSHSFPWSLKPFFTCRLYWSVSYFPTYGTPCNIT